MRGMWMAHCMVRLIFHWQSFAKRERGSPATGTYICDATLSRPIMRTSWRTSRF